MLLSTLLLGLMSLLISLAASSPFYDDMDANRFKQIESTIRAWEKQRKKELKNAGPDEPLFPIRNDWSCKSPRHSNPIIMLHGLSGTRQLEVNFLELWLRRQGFCTFSFTYGSWSRILPELPFLGGVRAVDDSSNEIATFVQQVIAATNSSKVDIVGHSEGAFLAIYIPRFWPLVGNAAQNIIAIGPPTRGTTLRKFFASTLVFGARSRRAWRKVLGKMGCPACDELLPDGAPIMRLRAATPVRLPHTTLTIIATRHDRTITPPETAFLYEPGVRNMYIQDDCPADPVEHIGLAVDFNVWNVVRNTLDKQFDRKYQCVAGLRI
ncbi:hypothetical protein CDD82_2861 [Ophiocordyceps australis]|uniref:AB hydrolase-1 domain-containing protein n=1 Tax=Ophiocordyceps australis TaxID=1399860 RepID=A0A2C5ZFH3_9HYPO|nr:hypothetical protein CDD82_2861 [Ophiocordyceps australis]